MSNNPLKSLETIFVPLEKLLLDEENPRLASLENEKSQFALLKTLYEEMSVDEVAFSIAENGFFIQEPLFVIPAGKKQIGAAKDKYIVVEGNRRLAAVLILINDEFRKKLKASEIPTISDSKKKRLKKLPVVVYPDRESLWEYLGFKHINGVKPWDAYSKASYVAEIHEKYKFPLVDIATKIGDRHATVKRLYRGLTVLRQAEKTGFDREDRARNRFFFSHLYTALDQPEFQRFLGIDAEKSLRKDPVPLSKKKELKELMIWLYGSKSAGRDPIVRSQNPDLARLRDVISNSPSLAALRGGVPLDRSFEISIGDRRRFEEAVYNAFENLKQALGLVFTGLNRKDEDIQQAISQISELASKLKAQTEKNKK